MNWTISTTGTGSAPWGVFLNGKLVLGGYARSADATWARTFLVRNEIPPYLPPRSKATLVERLTEIHGKRPSEPGRAVGL